DRCQVVERAVIRPPCLEMLCAGVSVGTDKIEASSRSGPALAISRDTRSTDRASFRVDRVFDRLAETAWPQSIRARCDPILMVPLRRLQSIRLIPQPASMHLRRPHLLRRDRIDEGPQCLVALLQFDRAASPE